MPAIGLVGSGGGRQYPCLVHSRGPHARVAHEAGNDRVALVEGAEHPVQGEALEVLVEHPRLAGTELRRGRGFSVLAWDVGPVGIGARSILDNALDGIPDEAAVVLAKLVGTAQPPRVVVDEARAVDRARVVLFAGGVVPAEVVHAGSSAVPRTGPLLPLVPDGGHEGSQVYARFNFLGRSKGP